MRFPFFRRRPGERATIEEALKGLPPDPASWAEEVFNDPAALQKVHLSFLRLEQEEGWKFFRAMLARKIERLQAELRVIPRPGERDRANELRAVISVLESLLALPADVARHAAAGRRTLADMIRFPSPGKTGVNST